jgi:hypothetical protein
MNGINEVSPDAVIGINGQTNKFAKVYLIKIQKGSRANVTVADIIYPLLDNLHKEFSAEEVKQLFNLIVDHYYELKEELGGA